MSLDPRLGETPAQGAINTLSWNDEEKRALNILSALDPRDAVLLADCDLTLALKHPDQFHEIALDREQYGTLRTLTENFALSAVVTARGEESTLNGLYASGPSIPDLVIASNTGHYIWMGDDPASERFYAPINGFSREEIHTIADTIHLVLETVRQNFTHSSGRLIVDVRELLGALVYEGFTGEDVMNLKAAFATAAKQHIPGELRDRIKKVAKDMPQGNGLHNGYIDVKPPNMCKGDAVRYLLALQSIQARLPRHPLFVVAGDSAPDLAMMREVTRLYGHDNVLNLWVGDDRAHEEANEGKDTKVSLIQLRGSQYEAIPKFYQLMGVAAAPSAPIPFNS